MTMTKRYLQTVIISPKGLRTGTDRPFRGLEYPLDLISYGPECSFMAEIRDEKHLRAVMVEVGFSPEKIDRELERASQPGAKHARLNSTQKLHAAQAINQDFLL